MDAPKLLPAFDTLPDDLGLTPKELEQAATGGYVEVKEGTGRIGISRVDELAKAISQAEGTSAVGILRFLLFNMAQTGWMAPPKNAGQGTAAEQAERDPERAIRELHNNIQRPELAAVVSANAAKVAGGASPTALADQTVMDKAASALALRLISENAILDQAAALSYLSRLFEQLKAFVPAHRERFGKLFKVEPPAEVPAPAAEA